MVLTFQWGTCSTGSLTARKSPEYGVAGPATLCIKHIRQAAMPSLSSMLRAAAPLACNFIARAGACNHHASGRVVSAGPVNALKGVPVSTTSNDTSAAA